MKDSNEITKTYMSFRFPVFQTDSTYFTAGDTIAIIDYKDYSLYELRDFANFQNANGHSHTQILYRYFLLKKKEKYGYYYKDSLMEKVGRKTKIDTFLTKRAFYGQTLYNTSGTELIDFQKNKRGFDLIEKYKCPTKINLSYPDTIMIYYSNKLKNTSFSLCGELDSLKKIKVQKIRGIYNSQFIKGYPNKLPRYEIVYELKKDSVTDLEKYKRFIDEKIKKDR
jgi:hypothetical protein